MMFTQNSRRTLLWSQMCMSHSLAKICLKLLSILANKVIQSLWSKCSSCPWSPAIFSNQAFAISPLLSSVAAFLQPHCCWKGKNTVWLMVDRMQSRGIRGFLVLCSLWWQDSLQMLHLSYWKQDSRQNNSKVLLLYLLWSSVHYYINM